MSNEEIELSDDIISKMLEINEIFIKACKERKLTTLEIAILIRDMHTGMSAFLVKSIIPPK